MSFATPKRQAASTNLQSTPQSAGSAARSKDLASTGLEVDVVGPWIARDVENAQECEVDKILKSFLSDCMDNESSTMKDPDTLFDTCLQSVLPICNGNVSKDGVDSAVIKTNLENYSQARREVDLYPHFVRAVNTALFLLRDLDQIVGLRKPSYQLVFQVYGKQMEQSHQGSSSIRKPDVILVSAADVQAGDTFDDLLEATAKKPTKRSSWRDTRTVIEFKVSPWKIKCPPSSYTNGEYIDPRESHKYLSPKPDDDDDDDDDEPLIPPSSCIQKSEPQSVNHTDKEPDPGILENSAMGKRKLSTREAERESQSKFGGRSNKASGSSSKRRRVETNDANPKKMRPAIQTGLYGSEMFASHAGREHVICLTVVGDLLYLWRYDRQRPIQFSALNFVQDLPRFLVLLLAMQRFENRHWGLNPHVDPNFGKLPTPARTVRIEDPKEGEVDLVLGKKRVSHYGLNGRATNVYFVTSQKFASNGRLVAKFFWGEESRVGEPEILEKVYEIARKEPDVLNHVPVMVFSHAFSDSSTAIIRKRLGLKTEGARVLYMIAFQELMEITKLTGHLALWKNGVYHRDISPSNMMYYEGEAGNVFGVLNDFDLATITPGPTGNERTGTVPFMALDLLSEKGLAGQIKHVYAYDGESFIWVLTWICLRYEAGVLRKKPLLQEWLKVDARGCGNEKSSFLLAHHKDHNSDKWVPGRGHERNWRVAKLALAALVQQQLSVGRPSETCDLPFQLLLEGPYNKLLELESCGGGQEEEEMSTIPVI